MASTKLSTRTPRGLHNALCRFTRLEEVLHKQPMIITVVCCIFKEIAATFLQDGD